MIRYYSVTLMLGYFNANLKIISKNFIEKNYKIGFKCQICIF